MSRCPLTYYSDYYLPKDEIEFYQFCYIDSNGKVRGASTPFCFKNPAEQSLDSSPDDDLLVITTQVPNTNKGFGAKASDCVFSSRAVDYKVFVERRNKWNRVCERKLN